MFASFSLAGFFPPAESMETSWFSGSTVWNLDIFSVVNKCLETVASKDIVLDVILTSEKTLKQIDASNFNTIQVLLRYLEVSRYYSNMNGLLKAKFAYPGVNFRYVISPSRSLPSNTTPLVSHFSWSSSST